MSDTRVQDCPEEAFVLAKAVDHSLNKYSLSIVSVISEQGILMIMTFWR